MFSRVLTITGPSGSGKSELVKIIQDLRSDDFDPVLVPKWTTRQRRRADGPEVRFAKVLPGNCDIAYEQYGVRYGLQRRTLWDCVAKGQTPIVILNDVRAVEDTRLQFGSMARAIYVFRKAPSYEDLMTLSKQRGAVEGDDESYRRFLKGIMIHRIYIENLQLFDWVILNVHDTLEPMRTQISSLLKSERGEPRVMM